MKRNTLFLLAAILAAVLLLAGTAFAEDGETREVADLASLKEAIEDTTVDAIKLTGDISEVDAPITIQRSLTLDLGKFTISDNGNIARGSNNGLLMVKGGTTESVKVTIKNGKITSKSSYLSVIRTEGRNTKNPHELTLEDLEVDGGGASGYAVRDAGTWHIRVNSGTYKGKNQYPILGSKCYFSENVKVISTTSGMNPFKYTGSDRGSVAELPDGYYADVAIDEDGNRVLTVKLGTPPVFTDNINGANFYRTISEAIEAGKTSLYMFADFGSAEHPSAKDEIPEGITLTLRLLTSVSQSPGNTLIYYGDIQVNGTLKYIGNETKTGIIGAITFGENGSIEFENTNHSGIFTTDFREHIKGKFTLVETESDYTEQNCWKVETAYIEDDSGNTYSSINQAIQQGATKIILNYDKGEFNDHKENVAVPTGKEITIDLNGRTLKGGVTGKFATITVDEGATLTMEGKTSGSTLQSAPVYNKAEEYAVDNHGTLTLNNVTVRGIDVSANVPGGPATSISRYALIYSDNDLTINGGSVTNLVNLAPAPDGVDYLGNPVEECDGGIGVYIRGGNATIKNTTITAGFNGVYVEKGNLKIEGESTHILLNANTEVPPASDGRHAEAVDAKEDSMVTITGGHFSSNVSRFVPNTHVTKREGTGSGDACYVTAIGDSTAESFATNARIIFIKNIHMQNANEYQIILESADEDKSIYSFKEAKLSFEIENAPHLNFKITSADNVSMTEADGVYTFKPADNLPKDRALTGNRIVLGTVTFSGVGKGNFVCKTEGNTATATKYSENTDLTLALTVNENVTDGSSNVTAYGKAPVEITTVTVKAGDDYTDPVSGAVFSNKSETDATLTYGDGDSITVEGEVTAKLPTVDSALTVGSTKYTAGDDGVELVIEGSTVTVPDGYKSVDKDGGKTVYRIYTVTLTAGAGGKAEIDNKTAIRGDTITVTVKEIDEGYKLIGVVAVGGTEDIKVTNGGDGKHTFTMPAADVTVNVSFAAETQEGDGITIVEEPTLKFGEDTQGVKEEDLQNTDVSFASESLKDVGNAVTEDDTVCTADNAKQKLKEEKDVEVEEGEDVYLHVLTTVNIEVEEYSATTPGADGNVLRLNISPVIVVVASTEPDIQKVTENNSVDLTDPIPLTVSRTVDMVLPVPANFAVEGATVYIKHTKEDNAVHWYTGKVESGVVKFENPDGFSTFELRTTTDAEAKIKDKYYNTLKDAVDAAKDGDVIELNKDCNEDVTVSRTVEFTLKKGNHSFNADIKGSGYYAVTKDESVEGEIKYTVYYAGPYTYSVKTEAAENVELKVSASSVPAGETVTVTPAPAENYHVSAVTVTAAGGKDVEVTDNKDGTYTFKMPSSNVTVTAAVYECPSLAFPDIDLTQWYHPYTDYAIANNLMKGTDLGFEPERVVTRAQMAGILWTLYGSPEVDYEIRFPDVPKN